MLVIGSEVVLRYFGTRAGHQGIEAARTQYNACWPLRVVLDGATSRM